MPVNQPSQRPPQTPPQAARSNLRLAQTAASQQRDDKTDTGDQARNTITTFVNEVNVVFTVTDKHNHYVKDLNKTDFKVVDDEKPVPQIRSFRRETDLPLQVGLLIDASNSIRDRFKFEQESAIEFLNDTIRRKYDQAFVVGFDATPEAHPGLHRQHRRCSPRVCACCTPAAAPPCTMPSTTPARDKLLKSPSAIRCAAPSSWSATATTTPAMSPARKPSKWRCAPRSIVYTISTNFPVAAAARATKFCERIAEATGGRSFEPFQLTEVANAFAQIQDDLRSQYALSYHPADFAQTAATAPSKSCANTKA